MNVLILKLGATGDVVRTTPLLRAIPGDFTWITAAKNRPLVEGVAPNLKTLAWEERHQAVPYEYDLVISLEDEPEVGAFLRDVRHRRVFGAYLDAQAVPRYTADASGWFDLSLISVHGRQRADQLKARNRRTYQDHIFSGLGLTFSGEEYLLPETQPSDLRGDVAIAPEAGPVWPMKKWAYYDSLKQKLEARGYGVNVLPARPTLLEHLADVRAHRVLVSGDSLPMHLALGSGLRCVSLFNCTSPWEIHEYGRLTKMISPLLDEFFYQRAFDPRATTAIALDDVFEATLRQLSS